MNTSTSTTAFGLAALFLPLALLYPDIQSTRWAAQIELELQELQEQPDKLAYCRTRALQLQWLQIPLQSTRCGHILYKDLKMSGDMLLESRRLCYPGWELFGGRCRRLA